MVLAWDDSWLLSSLFLFFGFLPWALPKDATGDLFAGFYLGFLFLYDGHRVCFGEREPQAILCERDSESSRTPLPDEHRAGANGHCPLSFRVE